MSQNECFALHCLEDVSISTFFVFLAGAEPARNFTDMERHRHSSDITFAEDRSRSFSGPAFSFRNFRRDYDDSDDSKDRNRSGPEAAATFSTACPPDAELAVRGGDDDLDARCDVDSDEETYSKGRKRRFHSSSSSSQSPYRSCQSSLSPQNSASYSDAARESSEDPEEDDEKKLEERRRGVAEEERKDEDDKVKERPAATTATTDSSRQTVCVMEEEEYEEGWKELPVILLEDIFVMLTPKQRHQASMVCRPWYEIFYSPRVWETFVLFERTLTRRRFNLYKGYQRELCPRKTQVTATDWIVGLMKGPGRYG